MQRAQWLKWRNDGIGSSDAPIIYFEKSPWGKTLEELWIEKVNGETDDFDNPYMQRGRELEPIARDHFCQEMDVEVFPRNMVHPQKDWLRASLDGIDLDEKVMVEIKCPGKKTIELAREGRISDYYMIQCQHQMLVTGLKSMFFYCFDGENGIAIPIPADKYIQAELFQKEERFWNCVVNLINPAEELVGAC